MWLFSGAACKFAWFAYIVFNIFNVYVFLLMYELNAETEIICLSAAFMFYGSVSEIRPWWNLKGFNII